MIKLDGKLVMTDPVFSDRASPVQWMGPKRFHPTPITSQDLPDIDVMVISHDHYDHLDKGACR
jgi:L-ascorbate metabolism protein UlaG (beta-lactamase superfamily)